MIQSATPYITLFALLAFWCIFGLSIIFTNNPLSAAVYLGVFSVTSVSLYIFLNAPDVSMTEASIGLFVSLLFYLSILKLTKNSESFNISYTKQSIAAFCVPFVLFSVSYIMILLQNNKNNVLSTREASKYYILNSFAETGVANVVTTILASYRAYDTMGETLIIFIATIGAWMILKGGN